MKPKDEARRPTQIIIDHTQHISQLSIIKMTEQFWWSKTVFDDLLA
jgi:hypothetical protein